MGFFSAIFAPGEQSRGDELDRRLAAENVRDLESGRYDRAIYEQAQANLDGGRIDVDAQVGTAFDEGLKEGADTIRTRVGGVINSATGLTFRLIPWQVWVIAGIVAFFYLGGGQLLGMIVAKRLAK